VVTDEYGYSGESYDLKDIKIDQLKKFLNTFAYSQKKVEKKAELTQLTLKKSQNPNTGLCGLKTSNLCVILFL
jgi:hypothetical protein